MITRSFWISRVLEAWKKRSIVWLAGVRRSGKTTLAKMLPKAHYLNCDLPSSAQRLEDPESFFSSFSAGTHLILDEVHRLPDPSRILKIAADEYPRLRILATGSSTLAATKKFRDSLTGRKGLIHLLPILWTECQDSFHQKSLEHRLFRGGLPELFLAETRDEEFYAEWLDSFYARDIQELFGIRERTGFLNLFRLLLRQSGCLVDYSNLARETGLHRNTVKAHLEAITIACALFPVPPFSGGGRRELVKRPKVYAFDTGFVAFARGWDDLRSDDCGLLWEHLVLDQLRACVRDEAIHYWRDKSDREIDFVIPQGKAVHTIECKMKPDKFTPETLRTFRQSYPNGKNLVVSPMLKVPFQRNFGDIPVSFIDAQSLSAHL